MKESIPSSAHPPHAAQKPRTWLRVRSVGAGVVAMGREYTGGMRLFPLAPRVLVVATTACIAFVSLGAEQHAALLSPAETLLAPAVARRARSGTVRRGRERSRRA